MQPMDLNPFMGALICYYGRFPRFGGIPQAVIDAKTINERDLVFYYEHTTDGQDEWLERQEETSSKEKMERKKRSQRKERRKKMIEDLD